MKKGSAGLFCTSIHMDDILSHIRHRTEGWGWAGGQQGHLHRINAPGLFFLQHGGNLESMPQHVKPNIYNKNKSQYVSLFSLFGNLDHWGLYHKVLSFFLYPFLKEPAIELLLRNLVVLIHITKYRVLTQLAKPLTSNKEQWRFLILRGHYRNTSIILLFRHIYSQSSISLQLMD